MKKFILLFFVIFNFSLFAQPAGLKFNGRYLTDEELDKKYNPTVRIPGFSSWQCEAYNDEINTRILLNPVYSYLSRYFAVEEDASRKQWIHLSTNTTGYSLSDHSGQYPKICIEKKDRVLLNRDYDISFMFSLNSTNPSVTIDFFRFYVNFPNQYVGLFNLIHKNGNLLIKYMDGSPQVLAQGGGMRPSKILCPYKYGDLCQARLLIQDGNLDVYINGEKLFSHSWGTFDERVPCGWKPCISNISGFSGFIEAFFGDYSYKALKEEKIIPAGSRPPLNNNPPSQKESEKVQALPKKEEPKLELIPDEDLLPPSL